ncbi:MAG: MFS transporter [Spirochaetes bacterium]|nr:MFS transporter [Spirochaetota bacterium]
MTMYADTLSDAIRKKFRTYAYASTWVGCFSDVMLENSAIIILYLAMLRASNTLIMLSTCLVGIISMFLMIPASGIVDRLGSKRVVLLSSAIGCLSYLIMASAPFLGKDIAPYIVCLGCLTFGISQPLATAAWYPIVGHVFKPSERADFFGFLRFSYFVLTGSVFFLLGIFMGEKPQLWFLQLVIGITGIIALGRYFFIARIVLPAHESRRFDIKKALGISTRNGLLAGFAVYVCFLSLAFAAIQPLTLIYLKNGLHYSDNIIQMISSAAIGGSVCGFFFYGRIVRRVGIRNLQLMVHGAYILIPLGLFFCGGNNPYLPVLIGILLVAGNIAYACFVCALSQESFALARPVNITTDNAFTQTYQMVGTASGRAMASLLLGNGVLAATWKFWNGTFSNYQTIFLLCSGIALFCLILIICIPSVAPVREYHYNP